MAQDNPFLGFFESMGVGMEAGAQRRSLMERARQGKLEPGESVPSLGRTILQGITRAATPASTRLAQDQLKLQAANQALDYSLRERQMTLREQDLLLDKTSQRAKIDQQINDNQGYRFATRQMQSDLASGKLNALRSFQPPQGMSQEGQEELFKFRDNLLAGEQGKRLVEMGNMREELSTYIPQDQIPTTYAGMKRTLDRITSMEEQEIAERKAEAAIERGVSVLETTPRAAGVNINYPGGQLFLSNKKDEATEEFRGLSDAEIQRRYLGIATTNLENRDADAIQRIKRNEQWLRDEATKRGLSLPEESTSTTSSSLLDLYRARNTRMGN
jgi:sulfur transfer protein SufE